MKSAAASFLLMLGLCAGAAPPTPPAKGSLSVSIYQPGAMQCGDYLSYREARHDMTSIHGFVWGFLSANNFYNPASQAVGDLSAGTVSAYLDKYCRDNPLNTLMLGIVQLGISLGAGPSRL